MRSLEKGSQRNQLLRLGEEKKLIHESSLERKASSEAGNNSSVPKTKTRCLGKKRPWPLEEKNFSTFREAQCNSFPAKTRRTTEPAWKGGAGRSRARGPLAAWGREGAPLGLPQNDGPTGHGGGRNTRISHRENQMERMQKETDLCRSKSGRPPVQSA